MIGFRRSFLVMMLFCVPATGFAFSLSSSLAVFFMQEAVDIGSDQSRIQAWKALIADAENDSDWQKLNRVNQFFNQMNFREDKVQWGVEDYWASPLEFLRQNAGDCEDYSIAKYFTLKAIGVSVDRLRLTYVTNLPSQQAHMVLVYLEGPEKTPLVLDNLKRKISPFSSRMDLDPVYSFNANGLWIAHRDSSLDQMVSRDTRQIAHWQALSQKMADERML